MKIAVGSDHRGFPHKELLRSVLAEAGHTVEDCGCHSVAASDYPDAAFTVSRRVADGRVERGILICGSGVGMSIAANKVAGIRAALCLDAAAARATREHNDSNVLCLSGDRVSPADAVAIATAWLAADFAGGRHARRVAKIVSYEREHCR